MSKELNDLLEFLNNAPTAWHAVELVRLRLIKAGFQELNEKDRWNLKSQTAYFVIRNGSSLCAFVTPIQSLDSVTLVASHTDSPGFKLKPNSEFRKENMIMLGLEVYGGPLLTSWLNRDLGIAGRVVFEKASGTIEEALVRMDEGPVIIPQLAIHLDRTVNETGLILNKQEHLAALAAIEPKKSKNEQKYLISLIKKKIKFKELLGSDLFLFPLEKAKFIGSRQEMIAAYRIDSLNSVEAALTAFVQSKKPNPSNLKMIAFWDNEEIGSNTAQGAGSPFVSQVIERIAFSLLSDREDYLRLMRNSLCVSVDLAHALHPSYPDKNEPRHPVFINEGVVIKFSAQQRYATDAHSMARIISICQNTSIPFQKQVARGDIPCGSTIGPIHASLTGMPTVDIGTPQLSMHSCREVTGCQDHIAMRKLLQKVFDEN